MDVRHGVFLSLLLLAGSAKSVKVQMVIGDLKSRRFHYLPGPLGDITKIELNNISASLANDVVMVLPQLTNFISYARRGGGNFEGNAQRLKKLQRSIDRSQAYTPVFLSKTPVKLLGGKRTVRIRQLVIDEEPRAAQSQISLFQRCFDNVFVNHKF